MRFFDVVRLWRLDELGLRLLDGCGLWCSPFRTIPPASRGASLGYVRGLFGRLRDALVLWRFDVVRLWFLDVWRMRDEHGLRDVVRLQNGGAELRLELFELWRIDELRSCGLLELLAELVVRLVSVLLCGFVAKRIPID